MYLFSNGSETANLVVSSGLLQQSWTANSNLYGNSDPNERLRYKVYPQQHYNILAFVTSPRTLQGDQADLVSSSTFPLFEFLCSKNNPSFSINKDAISLFDSYRLQLSLLEVRLCQDHKNTPLIITGHSLGGSIASLFTFSVLNTMDLSKYKRPLCITFGSPLIGDSSLQEAIFQYQTWNSCFLHVVSNQDPVPRIFLHHHNPVPYRPFGTFLFCSESGCACFEDPDSIFKLLVSTTLHSAQDQDPSQAMPLDDYEKMVENLQHRTVLKDTTELVDWAAEPYHEGIVKQLIAIGVPRSQQRQINIKHLKNRELELQIAKKFDPSNKLNDMKIYMAYLEWYKKCSKDKEIGYYDMYKNKMFECDIVVEVYKKKLTNYWIDMVKELEKKPRKELEAFFRTPWLFAGTNYRRMVEPLDIADFYKEKGLNYETQGRSEHYIWLEKWLNKFDKSEINSNSSKREIVASIMTVDSCFWAKVEEAIILCNSLKRKESNVEEKEASRSKLKDFENHVWGLLKNYQVSPEIFITESSFMKWWKDYKKTIGSSFTSPLDDFMKHGAYEQYANGTWSPPINTLLSPYCLGPSEIPIQNQLIIDETAHLNYIGRAHSISNQDGKFSMQANIQQFSNGSETANLMVSSGLLQQSWTANWNLYENSDPNERLRFHVYPQGNYNILAFVTSPWTLQGDQADLASSSTFKETFPVFEFLCSEKNPTFAINKAAIFLFASYHDKLLELKNQLCPVPPKKDGKKTNDQLPPLIITGHSRGGSIASLFTLWMLNTMDLSKSKRPLCITFGSPLIGDNSLYKAIFQSKTWNSCFLHVVSNQDPVPRIFIHHIPVHQKGVYKPFGTFLICSESGSACFEDPDSILELLASYGAESQNPYQAVPLVDYGPAVKNLYHQTFCRDAIELVAWAMQPFDAGIIRQLRAIGVARSQNIDIINLVKREKHVIAKKKSFDPSKKLNDMKINMAYLEWYKKWSKDQKTGYYDIYKKKLNEWDIKVEGFKKDLTNYWIDMVKEVENKPQKEGAAFRIRWLFGGTNYRRMVEPLDIAEYYKGNKLNYETQGRSDHYIKLEEWQKEEKKSESNPNNSKKEKVSSILTIDSCFWAKVEEAIILLKTENFGAEEKVKELKDFEDYVWGLLTKYEVSPEIFLPESSFMKWWKDWKAYKRTLGSSLTSPLHDFIESGAYVEYDRGNWSPPIYTQLF